MTGNIVLITCAFLLIINAEAFIRRDVSSTSEPDFLGSIQKNLDAFRKCLDQSLAGAIADVNEKKLNPALNQFGDSLNRVSKAFDDLTAPNKVGTHY